MHYIGFRQYLVTVCLWFCSTSYAQTENSRFLCKDWYNSSSTFEGSFFIGQKTKEGFIIRDNYKDKIQIKYIGNYNHSGVTMYSGINPIYKTTEIYAVYEIDLMNYDFQIKKFNYAGTNPMSECNYE